MGNSGWLRGSGHGLQIDAHDCVLRWVTWRGLAPSLSPQHPGCSSSWIPCETHGCKPCNGRGHGCWPCSRAQEATLGHTLAPCHSCALFAAGWVMWCPCLVRLAAWSWHSTRLHFSCASPLCPRMNRAQVAGFELDVGRRTTHRFVYPESAVDVGPGVRLVLVPFKPLDLQWAASAFSTGELTRCVASCRPEGRWGVVPWPRCLTGPLWDETLLVRVLAALCSAVCGLGAEPPPRAWAGL